MAKLREEVLRIVHELGEELTTLYGERLTGVYLYGSYARGEADEDSDIDVAIVLGGPVDARKETHRVIPLFSDLSLRENCLLVPFFLTDEEYRATPYAVHRNIVREGVPA